MHRLMLLLSGPVKHLHRILSERMPGTDLRVGFFVVAIKPRRLLGSIGTLFVDCGRLHGLNERRHRGLGELFDTFVGSVESLCTPWTLLPWKR